MAGNWNWRQINFDCELRFDYSPGFCHPGEDGFSCDGDVLYLEKREMGTSIGVTGNRSGSGVFLNNDILDITLNIGKINIGGDVEYLTVHRVS